MNTDSSIALWQQLLVRNKPTIQFHLQNGTVVTGRVISFTKGDLQNSETYISGWQVATNPDIPILGIDAFGNRLGTYIHHSQITYIRFEEDGMIIR